VFDASEFMLEIVSFMETIGVFDLPGSGLRFPASGWDWDDCCHACVWMAISGRELPDGLVARMFLGPPSPLVKLYVEWSSRRGEVGLPFDFRELAG
jgi:hypothetical protein